MNIFIENYTNYINFAKEYKKNNINNKNLYFQYGSGNNFKEIKKLLKKYKYIDIELDEDESSEELVYINVFNYNRIFTCARIILDYSEKKTILHDLKSDISCIKNNEKFVKYLVNVLIEISKNLKINLIELSDRSYHRCLKTPRSSFRLDKANTLTNAKPFYYKFNFKYENEKDHKNVIYNNKKIKSYITSELKMVDVLLAIEKNMKKKNIEEKDIINDINKMTELYEEYQDVNITKFLHKIKYEYCEIFSLMCEELFDIIELKHYTTNRMIINII